jgi:hypothetical protein
MGAALSAPTVAEAAAVAVAVRAVAGVPLVEAVAKVAVAAEAAVVAINTAPSEHKTHNHGRKSVQVAFFRPFFALNQAFQLKIYEP